MAVLARCDVCGKELDAGPNAISEGFTVERRYGHPVLSARAAPGPWDACSPECLEALGRKITR